jgi:2',3'-cyclic-nucleotide 2'-phosphodiesterase (5'-nucleotidase family)
VARRATFLDSVWNEGVPTLLIDGGDLMGRREKLEKEQSMFLCEMMGSFGYDAIGLGEMDLNYGLKFLQSVMELYQLPFTSANVRMNENGELILPEYLIVEKAGIRFGIISVLDLEQKILTMTSREQEFYVEDPIATLRTVIPKVRKEADTIIVISHLGDQKTEALLKEVEGVDVCIVGHTYRSLKTERAVGSTVLLAAVFEGREMGRADLDIDATGVVKAFTVDVASMDDEIANDPVVLEKVDAFNKHLEEVRMAMRGVHQQTKGSDDEEFLGEKVCVKCHEDVWAAVKETGHQTALATLREKGQGFNPDCLVCHVVGYTYKNGYDERPPYNMLGNVQCEACHGYGTLHQRDGQWRMQARESCTGCHDKENSPKFDFATYWDKIKH